MIKIASMVGGPDLEMPALAVYSGDLRAAFCKLSQLGYDGVELMIRRPDRLEGPQIRQWLDEYQLTLAGICTGALWGEDKLGLINSDLTVSQAAMSRFRELIDFAAYHFGPGTPINIGRVRGLGDPAQPEATLHVAADVFRELADYASPKGIRLLLEPITVNQVSFIITTQDGIEMVKRVGRPNFGLMLDVYHMNIEDVSVEDSFREAREYCWHVHVCDNNRRWPGSAHLDFRSIFAVLDEIGYSGFVGTEIQPWPDPDTAARCSISSLRRFSPGRRPVPENEVKQ